VTKNLALASHPVELAPMLTGSQIRAARALLRWSGQTLSEKSGVSYPAIQRAESTDDLPNMQVRNLAAIKGALEAAGVEFFDGSYSGLGGPGVRLK
jgi:transcriptional regulator with XRE-family HTH domain